MQDGTNGVRQAGFLKQYSTARWTNYGILRVLVGKLKRDNLWSKSGFL